jgi:hypothetical protein
MRQILLGDHPMSLATAQREMSAAHLGGAPSVLISGLVWLIAGTVWLQYGVVTGFFALTLGGILIFPAAVAVCRVIFHAPTVAKDNALNRLGLELTFFLFAGILIAYALLHAEPAFIFPIMAITIGVRYFPFRTLYDQTLYWVLAASLAGVGMIALLGRVFWPGNLAFVVGALEVVFAALLAWRNRATKYG